MSDRHSEAYLVDLRESWWNADWLALLAQRTALHTVRRALDVGCGQGHWTRVIASILPADATIDGVEREPDWVAKATARARPNMTFTVGAAQALPFPDASFDLVTCQTLLIHVPDPAVVIAEMRRVLKPGGRLLLAEPNNLPGHAVTFAATPEGDLEDMVEAVRFEAMVERGKRRMGEGDNSFGERLLGFLAGWEDVRAWLNDRARGMAPPYDPAMVADERRFFEQGEVGWSRAEALRWYLGAGGDEAAFARGWAATLRLNGARLAAIDAGTYAATDGSFLYVVHARKPDAG